ncbi:putative ubiquitin-conjugating enzyme E2 24 isoform X2 [Curcuma longa]|uniref:putative ubiquitin-conjugating enzyme E2 24 isoform X2 n=1 Tax=Curcuma longa TaxID=136217 RepID=UPI003D9DDF20
MDINFVDSDSDASTETSDSEDQDRSELVFGEHARSILSSLDESIGKIDDFLAFERGFTIGEIVCSATDPSGQLGRVVDVDLVVDLETNSGALIRDINSKKLLRPRSFAYGDFVVCGPWLGRVERVYDAATILLNDGTKYEMVITDSKVLTPVSPIIEDSTFPFYPGQRVKINLQPMSQSKLWLCGSLKANHNEGIIRNVEVGEVHVSWIASVLLQGIGSSFPSHIQNPKALTLLSCFPHANWQLGDWCKLPVDHCVNLLMATEKPESLTSPICLSKMQKELDIENPQMYVIAKTKSKVDILWQNGKKSVGVDPQSLSPVSNLGDHDFWPEQFVMEKVTLEDAHVQGTQRFGIVKNVDSSEQTVEVKWILSEFSKNVDVSGESTEVMSVYELIEHPDLSFSIGDVVLQQNPSFHQVEENMLDAQMSDQKERNNLAGAVDRLSYEKEILEKPIVEFHNMDVEGYLSCIGNVIGFKDELIEVKWANGVISKVIPSEIYGLDRLLHRTSTSSSTMESFTLNANKEMNDQEKQPWSIKQQKIMKESCMEDIWKAALLLSPRAAFDFFTHVATRLFKSLVSTLPSSYNNLAEDFQTEPADTCLGNLKWQVQEIEQTEELSFVHTNDEPRKFKQFDIVNDHSDHHFVVGTSNPLMLSQIKKGWFKRVQQEWCALKVDLPDSIYVRVYEERMDLLRASIIGAPGTPYHDSLFFFDIFLPSDYPFEPPVVHYISGGLRLNPNLYESGKVCLSLLKTWIGSGSEVWHPENSTVLQVLLSLQALVLNDKPYFNEAGFDEQIGRVEGEKNSVTYNENAFLQSCKSMLYILRKPPKHFEALVQEHFTRRSSHILNACKAYLEGSQVGRAYECGEDTSTCCKSCSTGFKIMLAKLVPMLVSAFTERGIICTEFVQYDYKSSLDGKDE